MILRRMRDMILGRMREGKQYDTKEIEGGKTI